jgi:hypothetical protein
MLVHYARELKEGFADYVEEVTQIMVPMLKFYFHDTVRVTAAESLPHLLECAAVKGEAYVLQLWSYMCPELLSAIDKEPEESVIPELMDSFSKCVETMDTHCMTAEQLATLGRIIHEKLEQHMKRQKERLDKRKDEDYDQEVEEELQDEHETDEYILSKVSDIMHVLFKTHWEAILPLFESLMQDFIILMDPNRPASDKQWTLCIFDDLIEYCGPKSWEYEKFFLKRMVQYIQDFHPEVRQAAAYGCGVMAQFGGEVYRPALQEALPLLKAVIEHRDSRSKENVCPTENCISAVTKICKHSLEWKSGCLATQEVLSDWLQWLPITEDKEEAPHVYGYLCDLVESNSTVILGADNSKLPQILAIIATAVSKEALSQDNECLTRLKTLLLQLKSNETIWNSCLQAIKDEAIRNWLMVSI